MSHREELYTFPAEVREAYEKLKFPFTVYQFIDGESFVLLVSDGYCAMKDIQRDAVPLYQPKRFYGGVHPEDFARVTEMEEIFIREESDWNVIYRSKNLKDGTYHEIHAVGTFYTMEDETHVAFITYRDLSRENPEKSISYTTTAQMDRCFIDPITRLPNIECYHKFADEAMTKMFAMGRAAACIYVDVDGMRYYNEEYGFEEGNRLLRIIADALRAGFEGALITRVGDDHFAVLTIWDDQTCAKLEEAIQRIGKRSLGRAAVVKAGVSPQTGKTKSNAVKALDQARFAAKRVGNDLRQRFVVYSPTIDDEYWSQRYIRDQFSEAIEKQWIAVFYHPIIRAETGKICNFEALARWIDPAKGMIAPDTFIPVLEKYHLVPQLGAYMLEQVIRQIKIRINSGFSVEPVSVNLSVLDFEANNMVRLIVNLLKKYDVDPKWIAVEITERDIAQTASVFKQQIKALRQHGIQVWVDDFGSGYSALNVLNQYEFDLLKLDMQFLRQLDEHHGANRVIIKAIVRAAHELGVQTLTEGVETEAHHRFLQEVGCDKEQGFYFSKPRPMAEGLLPDLGLQRETAEEARKYNAQFDRRSKGGTESVESG
ncbi:MAG: EAL domain-containing protein [Schwartzia sp. (in: firmicutes)]